MGRGRPKKYDVIEKHCEQCGSAFFVRSGKDQRYCSKKCWYAASTTNPERPCEYCGEIFKPYDHRARYCSLTCSSKAQAKDKVAKILDATKDYREARHKEAEIKKHHKKEELRANKMRQKFERMQNAVQIGFRYCERCGQPMIGGAMYCSDLCRRRANYSANEIRRRTRKREQFIENVSLEALYKRDSGICYLCGKACRYDDYIMRDGAFIAGDYYPSIDHIVPLSKGGEHSYANTKLAHRVCNTLKRDRLDIPQG